MNLMDALSKAMEPLKRQINGMVCRVVVKNVNDAPGRQELQVTGTANELVPVVEHFQPFGVSGYPPTDIDGIGLMVGGYRNHMVVLGAAPKVAGLPAKQQGDVVFHCLNPNVYTQMSDAGFHSSQGQTVWSAGLAGLSEYQFVVMSAVSTVIYVEDPDTHKMASITLTNGSITLQSTNGGTHVF